MVDHQAPVFVGRLLKKLLLRLHVVPWQHVKTHTVWKADVITGWHDIRDKAYGADSILKLDSLHAPRMPLSTGELNVIKDGAISLNQLNAIPN